MYMSNINLEFEIFLKVKFVETGTLLKNIIERLGLVVFLMKMIFSAYFKWSELKLIGHWKDHYLISSMTLLSLLFMAFKF